MYNRRVSKCHPRVEAYGAVDELNAAIGLARAATEHDSLRENLATIQKDLVILMGELATAVEDLPRYVKDGHSLVTPAMTATLEKWIAELESGESLRSRLGHAGSKRGIGDARLSRAQSADGRSGAACGLQESRPAR
jgi:cob(I)alamin adenosyltransferase